MIIESDSYSMDIYKDCPRKYNLRINQHLVPKTRAGGGRGFGSVLHKGRELWRQAIKGGAGYDDAREAGLKGVQMEWFVNFGMKTEVDPKRSLANAELLFNGYVNKFQGHPYIPISIEEPFIVDAGTTPMGHVVKRTGLMDEYCEFHGRRYVLDLKTTSLYPGGSWMDAWRTSGQFMGYVFAARRLHGVCDGVIVHGIWVHTPPARTTNKYKFDDYFTADIINFSDEQIEEWRVDFLRSIDRREEDNARGEFTANFNTACKTAYGLCDFHKWCSSTPLIRPSVENIYYAKQIWQPLEAERLGTVTPVAGGSIP